MSNDFRQNAESILMPSDISASTFGVRLADEYLSGHYNNEQVVGIADIHNNSDRYLATAIEIARRTGKSLGIESIGPDIIQTLDQVRAGRISFDEYRQATQGAIIVGPNAKSYMGAERDRDFFDQLFHAAQSGVKIHSLQTRYGFEMGVGGNEQGNLLLSLTEQNHNLSSEISSRAYEAIGSLDLSEPPEKNFADYKNSLSSQIAKLPANLIPEYKQIIADEKRIRTDPDLVGDFNRRSDAYLELVERLAKITHPKAAELASINARISGLKDVAQIGDTTNFVTARLSGDQSVAETIARTIKAGREPGMVVLYGAGHFNHDETLGRDIDSNLRSLGISVNILDSAIDNPDCIIHRGDAGAVEFIGSSNDSACTTRENLLAITGLKDESGQPGHPFFRISLGHPGY